jgi:hypothetical protein
VTTFEACEALYFCREHILQTPGLRETLEPNEFIAKENIHLSKEPRQKEVREDNNTVRTSNGLNSSPPNDASTASNNPFRQGPLTFDPSPPREEEEDVQLATADDQAKLMHWHYCLGHLPFPSLKAMALNGKIPHKLAKFVPPKCAGCLFGEMTKLPWQGKESKSTHQVFVTTKPGKCVSIDQIESLQIGFFAQLKGKLTKKRYTVLSV